MYNEIIIAGFGGQGVLLTGTLVAQAAIEQGLHTTWFPSYGAEMRGGTANSTVIVSDEEIGYPIAFSPNALIALNEPSLNKFLPKMTKDAVIIANSSIIPADKNYMITPYFVPMTDIADKEIKNVRTANMVAAGALVKALELCATQSCKTEREILQLSNVFKAVEKTFYSKPELIDINKKAVQAGYDFIKEKI